LYNKGHLIKQCRVPDGPTGETEPHARGSTTEKGKFRIQERGISDEKHNEIQASQSSIATVDPLRRRRCNFSGRMCRGALHDCV
jgi:hypothetical protein